MIRPSQLCFLFAVLLVALPACSGGGGRDDDDDDDTPYVKPADWEDMDFAQRREYMEQVVQPTMEELFVAWDPELYPEVTCETCHGEDPLDVDYEMPNGLEPLDLDDFPLENSPDEEIREHAIFMNDEVKPTMAELLDQEPFPQGTFGCFECHERE